MTPCCSVTVTSSLRWYTTDDTTHDYCKKTNHRTFSIQRTFNALSSASVQHVLRSARGVVFSSTHCDDGGVVRDLMSRLIKLPPRLVSGATQEARQAPSMA